VLFGEHFLNSSFKIAMEEEKKKLDEESAATPLDDKKSSKLANERLEELLGYGWHQKFQVWVFLGFVAFIGSMNMFHLMFMVTKKPHRCALPGDLETR
jgi:hypothetical protein